MYIEANDLSEAKDSVEWLLDQYPTVDAPSSDKGDSRMAVAPKIMTVEESSDDEFNQ